MNDINHSEKTFKKHNNNVGNRLALWTLAWLVSCALLRFGAEYIWDYQTTYSMYALLLHLT